MSLFGYRTRALDKNLCGELFDLEIDHTLKIHSVIFSHSIFIRANCMYEFENCTDLSYPVYASFYKEILLFVVVLG